jgi:hypothetical protein
MAAIKQALEKKMQKEEPTANIVVLEQTMSQNKLWINMKTGIAQELAIKEVEKQKTKTLNKMIPPELMTY